MNRLLALIAISAIALCGCVTPTTQTGGQAPPAFSVSTLTPIVDSAAYTGTRVILVSRPEKRAVFEQVSAALTALIATDSVTLVSLKSAVDPILSANIRELRDPNTALIVDGAITIANAALGKYELTTQTQKDEVMAIAKATRNGIARALIVVPPPPVPTDK